MPVYCNAAGEYYTAASAKNASDSTVVTPSATLVTLAASPGITLPIANARIAVAVAKGGAHGAHPTIANASKDYSSTL